MLNSNQTIKTYEGIRSDMVRLGTDGVFKNLAQFRNTNPLQNLASAVPGDPKIQETLILSLAYLGLDQQELSELIAGRSAKPIYDKATQVIVNLEQHIINRTGEVNFFDNARIHMMRLVSKNQTSDIVASLVFALNFKYFMQVINQIDFSQDGLDPKKKAIDTFCEIFQANPSNVKVIGLGGAGAGKVAIVHDRLPSWVFRLNQTPIAAAYENLGQRSEYCSSSRVNNDLLCARIYALPGTSFDLCERVIPLNKVDELATELSNPNLELFRIQLENLRYGHCMVGDNPMFEAKSRNLGIVKRGEDLVVVAYDLDGLNESLDDPQNSGRLDSAKPSIITRDSELYNFVKNSFYIL